MSAGLLVIMILIPGTITSYKRKYSKVCEVEHYRYKLLETVLTYKKNNCR